MPVSASWKWSASTASAHIEGLAEATIRADIAQAIWRTAERLVHAFLARIGTAHGFSARFGSCIAALEAHVARAGDRIARLGS